MNRFVRKWMGWSGQSSSTLQIVIPLNCSECIYKYVSEHRYDCPQCSCVHSIVWEHSHTLNLFSFPARPCHFTHSHAQNALSMRTTLTHIVVSASSLFYQIYTHLAITMGEMIAVQCIHCVAHTLHTEYSSHQMCVFVGCRKSLLLPYMR